MGSARNCLRETHHCTLVHWYQQAGAGRIVNYCDISRLVPALNASIKRSTAVLAATRAVLFDLDGTLLDTAPDMVGALNQLLSENGRDQLPFENVRCCVSHGARALVRLGFPGTGEPEFERLRRRFLEIYRTRLSVETQLFDGVLGAVERLEATGVLWGIVTNKPESLTLPLLEHFGLRARASVIVSGDTLAERKPHPAPLLHAAAKLGVSPSQCIYIGDAERDV